MNSFLVTLRQLSHLLLMFPLFSWATSVVFTDDFGTGTDKSTSPYVIGLTFDANTVNDGQYAVTNNPKLAHINFIESEDHTSGDVDGKMLVVNAGAKGEIFYQRSAGRVDSNTVYKFSFWATSTLNNSSSFLLEPNISSEFEVSGTVLPVNTGNIPNDGPNWREFSIVFKPHCADSIDVILRNNVQSGNGNDLAIDDIQLLKDYIPTADETVHELCTFIEKDKFVYRSSEPVYLDSLLSYYFIDGGIWEANYDTTATNTLFDSTAATLTPINIGSFEVQHWNNTRTQTSHRITINVIEPRTIDTAITITNTATSFDTLYFQNTFNERFGSTDTLIQPGNWVLTTASDDPGTGNLDLTNQYLVLQEQGNYYLEYLIGSDSLRQITINVVIMADSSVTDLPVTVYNVLTPNGDGLNDYFIIKNIEQYPDNNLKIFNRDGRLVYEQQGYGQNSNYFRGYANARGISGNLLPNAVYAYIIVYVQSGNRVKKSGYLYLGGANGI